MDKQEQIEEMARVFCNAAEYFSCAECSARKPCFCRIYTEELVNAGYGNVKQYQERIEELEREFYNVEARNYQYEYQTDDETIAESKMQAVKKFAEKLVQNIMRHKFKYVDYDEECPFGDKQVVDVLLIQREKDRLIKELYGED